MLPPNIELHGIPNCDQVRRARKWLESNGVAHRFTDFKKDGVDLKRLARWQEAVGWEVLLNRKGTTWRGLPQQAREAVVDGASAAALMKEFPSLIKRPVLVVGDMVVAGFSEERYWALVG
jgi:arsenate reductase